MDFTNPATNNLDFSPPREQVSMLSSFVAETTIVRAIVEGSGGPDNMEISEAGLRFIRYMLSQSSSARLGHLPNFKDMQSIQAAARDFIAQSGGASKALRALYSATQAKG